jgi:hypothetical protein
MGAADPPKNPAPTTSASKKPAAARTPRRVPATPSTAWQKMVEAHRKRAVRHSVAGKWDAALAEIAAAREVVQAARRDAAALSPPKRSPQYEKELKALAAELRREQSRSAQNRAGSSAGLARFQERKAALDRKYGVGSSSTGWRQRLLAGKARFTLDLASLDDLAAAFLARKGDHGAAAAAREQALLARLEAFEATGRTSEAAAQAEKLLALDSARLEPYEAAAVFLQRRGEYVPAEAAWRRQIELVESGRARSTQPARRSAAPRDPRLRLPTLYRQLAFVLQQQGKTEEASRAVARASELERRGAARS